MKKSHLLSALILLTACKSGDSPELNTVVPVRSVTAYEIKTEDIRQEIDGFGNLSFRRKADITAAVDGTIRKIFADEGDHVTEGAGLASLYNIQLLIRREQAEAALFSASSARELAETKYTEGRLQAESRLISIEKLELELRQKKLELEHRHSQLTKKKELLSIGGSTEEEVSAIELAWSALETEVKILEKDILIRKIGFRDQDIRIFGYRVPADSEERKQILLDINSLTLKSELKVAEARVRSAETELESAEALLNETELRSPISGIVGARYMEAGERLKADGKIFTVFDSSEVDLVFAVPEEIGVLLQPGQTVELSLDAVKDRLFSAEIRQISPTIDTRSGNITIKAELNNGEQLFRPGMFSRFSITYGPPRTVIRIPSDALVRKDGNRGLVMRITGGRVYPQSIVIEAESDGMHEITEGLSAGDIIVRSPSPLLKEGDSVDVR